MAAGSSPTHALQRSGHPTLRQNADGAAATRLLDQDALQLLLSPSNGLTNASPCPSMLHDRSCRIPCKTPRKCPLRDSNPDYEIKSLAVLPVDLRGQWKSRRRP